MSTHCLIGYAFGDKVYFAYCQTDGYPEHMVPILRTIHDGDSLQRRLSMQESSTTFMRIAKLSLMKMLSSTLVLLKNSSMMRLEYSAITVISIRIADGSALALVLRTSMKRTGKS